MIKAMQSAQKAARKAIESTYTGVMMVSERQSVKDPNTHITSTKEVIVLENQPCKLSFETLSSAVQTDTVATISQGVKVFLSPAAFPLYIPPIKKSCWSCPTAMLNS